MGVTRTDSEATTEHQLGSEAQTAQHAVPSRRAGVQAPTTQLTSAAVGENCSNCGAPLAGDQRYCIQCGQRRGNGRFALAAPAAQTAATATTATSSGSPPYERSRWQGSAATVIAGIATLVLAMGVGVLIGHSGSTNAAAKSPPPTVITVGGGSSAGSTVGSTAHVAKHKAAAPKTEAAKATKAATASKPTTKAVQKASHAASSVLGGNSAGQQQSTISNGQTCKAGSAGCTGGHFTGNFFGQ